MQAGAHTKPDARGRRRDRVVDVAAVAEAHVTRGDALRQRDAPSPVRTGLRPRALAQLARVDRRRLGDHVDRGVRDRRPIRGPQPSAHHVRPAEPAHEQGATPPLAPVRGQPREVTGPIAVGRAAQRRIRPRPDRLARGDRPRDRPEDRRPIPSRILEQHPHNVLALRQLARVDVQRAVVDAQRARLGSVVLRGRRVGSDVVTRPRASLKATPRASAPSISTTARASPPPTSAPLRMKRMERDHVCASVAAPASPPTGAEESSTSNRAESTYA